MSTFESSTRARITTAKITPISPNINTTTLANGKKKRITRALNFGRATERKRKKKDKKKKIGSDRSDGVIDNEKNVKKVYVDVAKAVISRVQKEMDIDMK